MLATFSEQAGTGSRVALKALRTSSDLAGLTAAAVGQQAPQTPPPPLLVMLGRCPSPLVGGGLFPPDRATGEPAVHAATSELAVELLRDARALAGTDGRLVVLCLEASNPLWFCPKVRELELPRTRSDGVRASGCTCPATCSDARGAAGGAARGASTRPAARAINKAVLDHFVALFGREGFATFEFAGGGEASWLCDSAAGTTTVAACASLPPRMGDGQLAIRRHTLGTGADAPAHAVVSLRVAHVSHAIRRAADDGGARAERMARAARAFCDVAAALRVDAILAEVPEDRPTGTPFLGGLLEFWNKRHGSSTAPATLALGDVREVAKRTADAAAGRADEVPAAGRPQVAARACAGAIGGGAGAAGASDAAPRALAGASGARTDGGPADAPRQLESRYGEASKLDLPQDSTTGCVLDAREAQDRAR
eukprot:scaffold1219_cov502-Pavlova_lutheri.AAC.1